MIGGGATIHGPGQIVIYPIVNARSLKLSVKGVTEALEHVVVDLAAAYGAVATGIPGRRGCMFRAKNWAPLVFTCDVGSTHGLAININNDLDVFSSSPHAGFWGNK